MVDVETKETKPRPEIVVDAKPSETVFNAVMSATLPRLEPGHYYPAKLSQYDDRQLQNVEWIQQNCLKHTPHDIVANLVLNGTENLESHKFKEATPVEQYYIIKNLGYVPDPVRGFTDLKKLTNRLVMNGTLTRDQESELIQTHYYEQLFRSVKYHLPMSVCTAGTITAKSQTCRLLYQDEITFTAATDFIKAEITPGANISRNVGTYSNRDVTLTSYALIAEVEDHLTRDSGYDVMNAEVERLAHLAAFVPNYQIGQTWYDCEGADTVNLGATAMTLTEFKTSVTSIVKARYNPNACVMHYVAYMGLMADTSTGWNVSGFTGRATPIITGIALPELYGVNVGYQQSGGGYFGTGADCATGVMCDNRYAGFLIQRYPPIIENFRVYERAANATSVQWMTAAGLLYVNAIMGIIG